MTKYFAALFAVAFAFAVHAAAPTGPVTLEAKNGNVTFEHSKHSALKCETCHATAAGGKIEGFGKEKAHATCVECHKKEAKGPSKCADCHKKA
ncbi:MAG TPA: cytochrome c3 family protein [Anaeromyxobacter sp.]|nr:cytochrome c3 family protein [Anaeromyxobacter sp.]